MAMPVGRKAAQMLRRPNILRLLWLVVTAPPPDLPSDEDRELAAGPAPAEGGRLARRKHAKLCERVQQFQWFEEAARACGESLVLLAEGKDEPRDRAEEARREVVEVVDHREARAATSALLREELRAAVPCWPELLAMQCTRTLDATAAAARGGAVEYLIEAAEASPKASAKVQRQLRQRMDSDEFRRNFGQLAEEIFREEDVAQESAAEGASAAPPRFMRLDPTLIRKVKRLGGGAFGDVWLSRTMQLPGIRLAVKTARGDMQREALALENELKILEKIAEARHPSIVDVYGVVMQPGYPLQIAMEFVDLGSMTSWLKKEDPDIPTRVMLAAQSAGGLAHLHDRLGVLHRDLKLENILVGHGPVAKLTDFGVGRVGMETAVTAGMLTDLLYAPPEFEAGDYGRPGDVFALGATLYELVSGRPLFDWHFRQRIAAGKQKQRHRVAWSVKRASSERHRVRERVYLEMGHDLDEAGAAAPGVQEGDEAAGGGAASDEGAGTGERGPPSKAGQVREELNERMRNAVTAAGWPEGVPPSLIRIVRQCLSVDPFVRPTARELERQLVHIQETLELRADVTGTRGRVERMDSSSSAWQAPVAPGGGSSGTADSAAAHGDTGQEHAAVLQPTRVQAPAGGGEGGQHVRASSGGLSPGATHRAQSAPGEGQTPPRRLRHDSVQGGAIRRETAGRAGRAGPRAGNPPALGAIPRMHTMQPDVRVSD